MSHDPDVLDQMWMDRYLEARAFCVEQGRLPKQRECGVGKWLAKQREKARAGTLSSERLGLLGDLAGFAVGQRERAAQDHVDAVVGFARRHGRLPKVTEAGMEGHAQWIKDLRAGKVSVTTQQLEALTEVGYSSSPAEDRRDEFVALYKAFTEQTGRRRVSVNHINEDGYPLGRRYHRRRQAARVGEIAAGHRQQLDEAGFPWLVSA